LLLSFVTGSRAESKSMDREFSAGRWFLTLSQHSISFN
jgi:hypothetical protein